MSDVPISEVTNVSVSVATGGVRATGFGTIMVMGSNVPAGINTYTSLAAVDEDFLITDQERILASAIFGQTFSPPSIKMYLKSPDVSQAQTIAFATDFLTGNTVEIDYTYTTNAGVATTVATSTPFNATHAQTITDVTAALIATAGITTAPGVDDGPGSTFTVTSTSADILNGSITITQAETLTGASQQTATTTETVTAVNYVTEIAELRALAGGTDWYALQTTSRTTTDILRCASVIESVTPRAIFGSQDDDANMLDTAVNTNASAVMATAERNRTFCVYHDTDAEYDDAALTGNRLSAADPDTRTTNWANVNLGSTAVAVDDLTSTQSTNARSTTNGGNTYETIGAGGRTRPGQMCGGRFIDVVVTQDWTEARLEEELFNLLTNASDSGVKIPYTQPGIDMVEGAIRTVIERAWQAGHTVQGSEQLTMPAIASISAATKATRVLSGITLRVTLQGSIQQVTNFNVTMVL